MNLTPVQNFVIKSISDLVSNGSFFSEKNRQKDKLLKSRRNAILLNINNKQMI